MIVHLIGMGSYFNADEAAFRVLDHLKARQQQQGVGEFDLHFYYSQPASLPILLSELCGPVCILDALVSRELARGQLVELKYHELLATPVAHSSHGLGVREMLELGDQLDLLEQPVYLLGLCVGNDIERQLDNNMVASLASAVWQWLERKAAVSVV